MSARYDHYLRIDCWMKVMRRSVLERANHRCQCRKRCNGARATQVHHVSYARLGKEQPQDLLAVCDACHRWLHNIAEPKMIAANDNQLELALEANPAPPIRRTLHG